MHNAPYPRKDGTPNCQLALVSASPRESARERERESQRVLLCMARSPVAREGIGNFEAPKPGNASCRFTSFRHWYGYNCVNTSLASLPRQQ
jgi:hypothetical protein